MTTTLVPPLAPTALRPTVTGGYPLRIDGGHWPTRHLQGVAVDRRRGLVYWSFTTLLVKTDLAGRLIGSVGGFTGHLGDLTFDERDGRVYGSLEYKAAEAFYIAIFDVDRIDRVGMDAQGSDVVTTVYLDQVVDDYTADLDGDGVFDGDTADTADHRYGTSGIDGVCFGPRFGSQHGRRLLTVAYGVYGDVGRDDNDHQVLLQYDTRDWARYERPLVEASPHRNGPPAGRRFFLHTGNTTFGVQNLAYDDHAHRWFLGVYAGEKPGFPNYTLFAVDARSAPRRAVLRGLGGDRGTVLTLAPDGLSDSATGIRGWDQKADVGIQPLGDGLFYLGTDSSVGGLQTGTLTLQRWTGDPAAPFSPVHGG
jgi:hypothetical protein